MAVLDMNMAIFFSCPSPGCYPRAMARESRKNNTASSGTKSLASHPKLPRIARTARRLGRMIPAQELQRIPKDLSSQIDHYVYGSPKR
jgi:hypothetical protein